MPFANRGNDGVPVGPRGRERDGRGSKEPQTHRSSASKSKNRPGLTCHMALSPEPEVANLLNDTNPIGGVAAVCDLDPKTSKRADDLSPGDRLDRDKVFPGHHATQGGCGVRHRLEPEPSLRNGVA